MLRSRGQKTIEMNIKLLFALFSATITVVGYVPYLKDIFQKRTKPHVYTWVVWAITQGTAAVALWVGGGNAAVISLTAGTCLVVIVVFLSLKYGTKNITRSDTITLILALLAIVVWWRLKDPLPSVLMVSAIDGLGYIPTLRKSFNAPWSETLSFWAAMILAALFALLSSSEYNLLTMTYLATLIIANTAVFILCVVRRKSIPQPISQAT